MTAKIDELIERSKNGCRPKLLLKAADGAEKVELLGHDGERFLMASLGGKHAGKGRVRPARISDGDLMKAIIDEVGEEGPEERAPAIPRVLFEQDRDDWPEDLERRKRQARANIERVNSAPGWKVPTHPVIVLFDSPDENDPENARAKLSGPEIHLFDYRDPFTEFLHELAHAYWLERLSQNEKERWGEVARRARKDPPRLPGETDTGEHCFAIAYCYALKGELLDAGYNQILSSLWPDACQEILDVFKRVRTDAVTETIWEDTRVLVKAAIKGTVILEDVTAPARLETIFSANGVDWKRDGGRIIPTRGGKVDFSLLRKARGGLIRRVGKKEVLMKASASGQLYVDLDGVLVDLAAGIRELGGDDDWGMSSHDGSGGKITDKLWTDISKTPNFWSGLDWTADGKRLWSRIKKFNPVVLISVKMSAGKQQAIRGKKRWVEDNLGKNVRVVIVEDGDKGQHARRGDVLIDDDYNGEILKGWSMAGGTSVKHEDTRSTLKKLDDLGLK